MRSKCKNYAQCRVGSCRKEYKCSGATNSSMNYHLNHKHPEVSSSRQRTDDTKAGPSATTTTSSATTPTTTTRVALITDYCSGPHPVKFRIARMCAKDGFPFRVSSKLISGVSSFNYTRRYIYTFVSCLQVFSTSEDLQNLFEKANYTLSSSPNSIKTLVVKFAAQRKNDLIGILKQDLKTAALSMTMDEWTSTRNRRYTNVNVHKQGRHNNFGLIRIIGSCDALRFCSMLHQLLGEYGIDPKRHICGITTDGAAVMKSSRISCQPPLNCVLHMRYTWQCVT